MDRAKGIFMRRALKPNTARKWLYETFINCAIDILTIGRITFYTG